MKSTFLSVGNIRLGKIRWGSFELIFEGANSAGSWTACTLRIDWRLWRRIASLAFDAWAKERAMREGEMSQIEASLPAQTERRAA